MRRGLSNKVIGRDRICPACGGYNRSGTNVPKDCMWCSRESKEERSKAYRRALDGAKRLRYDKGKRLGLEKFRKKQKGRKDPINVSVVAADVRKAYREFFEINRIFGKLKEESYGQPIRIFRLHK